MACWSLLQCFLKGMHFVDTFNISLMLRCAGIWNYNAALGASSGSERCTPHTTADASPAKVGEPWPPSCTAFASLSADE